MENDGFGWGYIAKKLLGFTGGIDKYLGVEKINKDQTDFKTEKKTNMAANGEN